MITVKPFQNTKKAFGKSMICKIKQSRKDASATHAGPMMLKISVNKLTEIIDFRSVVCYNQALKGVII
jgi:hypothetical protein